MVLGRRPWKVAGDRACGWRSAPHTGALSLGATTATVLDGPPVESYKVSETELGFSAGKRTDWLLRFSSPLPTQQQKHKQQKVGINGLQEEENLW